MRTRQAFLIVLASLTSCGTLPPKVQTALKAIEDEQIPVCDVSTCAAKWSLAQIWFTNHATVRLQTATDTLLQTYDPMLACGFFGASVGYSADKIPLDSSRYSIRMRGVYRCGIGAAGLNPNDLARAFYHFINTGEDILNPTFSSRAVSPSTRVETTNARSLDPSQISSGSSQQMLLARIPLGLSASEFTKLFPDFSRVPFSDGTILFQLKEQGHTTAVIFNAEFRVSAVMLLGAFSPSTESQRNILVESVSKNYGRPESANGNEFLWRKDGNVVILRENARGTGLLATATDAAFPALKNDWIPAIFDSK